MVLCRKCLVFLCVFLFGCDAADQVVERDAPVKVASRVLLENQSNHSGVLLKFLDQHGFTVSDDSGFFDTGHFQPDEPVPDGAYAVRVVYPYFETKDTTVTIVSGEFDPPFQIRLTQLARFWVEPGDTTGVIGSAGRIRGYVENLSDSLLSLIMPGEQNRFAIRPYRQSWPEASCVYCQHLVSSVQGVTSGVVVSPGSTSDAESFSFNYIAGCPINRCVRPGAYDVYFAVGDVQVFGDYFGVPLDPSQRELQATLFEKPELISSARVLLLDP